MINPLRIKARFWIEQDGNPVIGAGRALILEKVDELGSLHKAAAELNMSYRYAWKQVRQMNEGFGEDIVILMKGGKGGGGGQLTEKGRKVLRFFRDCETELLQFCNQKTKDIR